MIMEKEKLTQDQQNQIIKWKVIITTYEAKGEECFSEVEVQKLLNEIQDFIRYGLPDYLFGSIQKVTDAIFEASLVLAEPEKYDNHYQKASRLLCLAIKGLCIEEA